LELLLPQKPLFASLLTNDYEMATAIETATMIYLYNAVPSPTAAKPAQQLFLLHFDAPRANATFVAEAGSQSVSAVPEAISEANYERSPADLAVAQLLRMEEWGADWDGNGAAKPLGFSLKDARAFVRFLSPESIVPQATLHADGHAILFVNSAEVYAELEFLENHRIGFYVRRGGEEWTDEISFDGRTLPEGLLRVGLAV
jgi:hypothetical protein